MRGTMRGGLLAAVVVWLAALAGPGAVAQEAVFLQIEAQPDRARAEAAARRYGAGLDNVVGYALGTGWYAIGLGPYGDRTAALAARRALRAGGMVPPDAFVVPAGRTAARFWPEGGAVAPPPATAAVAPAPVAPTAETPAQARRAEAALEPADRRALQQALAWFGHYDGAIDGAFGPATRRAMTDWQGARGQATTGVLSTAQREALLAAWSAQRAAFGFAPWRDAAAGLEITLPLAMVAEDAVTPPFLRFAPRDPGGPEILLISQTGTAATLAALHDLIQTLEAVPAEGPRRLGPDSFSLSGADGNRRAHAHAVLRDGTIKGFVMLWTAPDTASDAAPDTDATAPDMARAVAVMRDSLRDLGGALPDAPLPVAAARAGLAVRAPVRSASGFFVDAAGRVLTSATLTRGCARVTIDQHHGARVVAADAASGLALLMPEDALAPAAHARFAPHLPEVAAEVVLAGFALPEMTAPVLTRGRIAALEGLSGEAVLRRLSLAAEPGEVGGPVFDRSGAVLGMLLEPRAPEGRLLPDGVAFAAGAEAMLAMLEAAGVGAETADAAAPRDLADLVRQAGAMTVQVACWD